MDNDINRHDCDSARNESEHEPQPELEPTTEGSIRPSDATREAQECTKESANISSLSSYCESTCDSMGGSLDDHEFECNSTYGPGGYCSIHIGDMIGENKQFEVVNKLGFGISSTVWLCRDMILEKWRAIKVVRARLSYPGCAELNAMWDLRQESPEVLLENHVGLPLGHFWMDSPAGRHLCLVLRVMGPPVVNEQRGWNEPDQLSRYPDDHPNVFVDVAFQIAKGVQFLHSRGLFHGDLRPANILMQYEGVDDFDTADMKKLLGPARKYPVPHRQGKKSKAGIPEYLVAPADLNGLTDHVAPKVAIVDFGHSYRTMGGQSVGIPCDYAAPECLFRGPKASKGGPTDIWALACTIFAVHYGYSPIWFPLEETMLSMELILGPLQEPYRTIWQQENEQLFLKWGHTWDEHYLEELERGNKSDFLKPEEIPVASWLPTYKKRKETGKRQCGFDDYLTNLLAKEIQEDYALCNNAEDSGPKETGFVSPKRNENQVSRAGTSSVIASTYEADNHVIYPGYLPKTFPEATGGCLNANEESHNGKSGGSKNSLDRGNKPRSSYTVKLGYSELTTISEPFLAPEEERKEWVDPDHDILHVVWRQPKEYILDLADLLHQMLRYQAEDRVDASAVLRHNWFSSRGFSMKGKSSSETVASRKRTYQGTEQAREAGEYEGQFLRRSRRIAERDERR